MSFPATSTRSFKRSDPLSRVVLGTASLGGVRGPVDEAEAISTIVAAMDAGIRRIDTAPAYGDAEIRIGKALSRHTAARPWLSTKAGRYYGPRGAYHDFSESTVRHSLAQSLERLGVSHVDCLFIHEPAHVPPTGKRHLLNVLGELRQSGAVKALGLGGGDLNDWSGLLESGRFTKAITFNRLNAVTSAAVAEDIPALRARSVEIYGASLLHMGLLGDQARALNMKPPPWLRPADAAASLRLIELAKRTNCSLSSLALRFALGVEEMDFLIIGPSNRSQLHEAIDALCQGPLEQPLFDAVIKCQAG